MFWVEFLTSCGQRSKLNTSFSLVSPAKNIRSKLMKLSRFTHPFLATGAGLALALSMAPAGQAGQCTLANMVNNCARYNEMEGPSPTSVSYKFFDSKIGTNGHFQFEANSDAITEFTLSGQPNNHKA